MEDGIGQSHVKRRVHGAQKAAANRRDGNPDHSHVRRASSDDSAKCIGIWHVHSHMLESIAPLMEQPAWQMMDPEILSFCYSSWKSALVIMFNARGSSQSGEQHH
ncbi:hypothetical protein LIA77_05233 [Sarocladium implicatum]|nr:hypothetical protein LIA77_05233 [Sarocladium implicatum]